MLVRVLIFGLIYGALLLVVDTPYAPDPSVKGWAGVVFGYWLVHALFEVHQRARTVSALVRGLSTTDERVRWRGSRVRLWLALFFLGHAANAHGQSVSYERGGE